MTYYSVGSHDPFRKVEASLVREHLLDFMRHRISIFRVHERHVLGDARRLVSWLEAMDPKQFRGPVVEPSGMERPAAHMREPLALREVELGLLVFLDVEVDPDPAQERSIRRSEGFGATQKPAVPALGVTHPKAHVACGPAAETPCPDSARFIVVVRVQQRDMRVPCGLDLGAGPQRMILRNAQVLGGPFVHERERTRRRRVPRVRGDQVQRGSQLRSKRFIHRLGSGAIV
ncbi:MAG TPA: hypothetical protein VK762_06280 [Polyangiaceae bacterium]|nr:hypothetical protein [Polyangiaceae bacterium]